MEPKFRCPTCRSKMRADQQLSGQEVACPKCSTLVMVPKVSYSAGDVIAGFRLESWIGSGSMGEVYKARQLSMDREVAIKLLRPDMLEDAEHIDRFNSEVRTLAKLDHPNIVTAFEAGQYEHHYFLAMSFVNGYNLDECLLERERLEEHEVLSIAIKVARALAYAWNRFQILHRDIKPSNIMIDSDGEVKLTDVGIAMHVGEDLEATQSGFVVGTPFYMSPEQAGGKESLDFRADMFSLGSTMYHLMVGLPPYDGDTPMEIMLKVINEPAPDPRQFNPEISEAAAGIIRKMMAKQRDERYATWEEMIDAAQRVVSGEPAHPPKTGRSRKKKLKAQVPPISSSVPLEPPPRSATHWLLPLLAAVIGLGLIGAVVFQIVRSASDPAEVVPPAPRVERPVVQPPVERAIERPVPPPAVEKPERPLAAYSKAFDTAMRLADQSPTDYTANIERFEAVAREAAGTPVETRARRQIAEERKELEQMLEIRRKELRQEAQQLIERDGISEAIKWMTDYDGPLATELFGWRQEEIKRYRKLLQEAAQRERSTRVATQSKLDELVGRMANHLVAGNVADAQQEVATAADDPAFAPLLDEVKAMEELIGGIRNWQAVVLDTFRGQIGQEVQVRLKRSTEKVTIKEVESSRVKGLKVVDQGKLGVSFSLAELDYEELHRRLVHAEDPAARLALGLLSLRSREVDRAAELFNTMPAPLSLALLRALHAQEPEPVEAMAEKELKAVYGAAGLPAESTPIALYATLMENPPAKELRDRLREPVNAFLHAYDFTGIARGHRPILETLSARRSAADSWPFDRQGLVFIWGPGMNVLHDVTTGYWRQTQVEARGGAAMGENNALILPGGEGICEAKDAGELLLTACQRTNQLTVEVVLHLASVDVGSDSPDQRSTGAIAAFGGGRGSNFLIGQRGQQIGVRLDTDNDSGLFEHRTSAFKGTTEKPIHLLLTHRDGATKLYVDGRKMIDVQGWKGGFSEWSSGSLTFGNTDNLELPWAGRIECAAVYAREFSAAEAAERFRKYSGAR